MKFIKENTGNGVLVSNAALKLSSIDAKQLELRTENGAAILLKRRMTVSDMLKAIMALDETISDLLEKLEAACGACDCCSPECLFGEEERGDIPENLTETLVGYGICMDTLYSLMDEDVIIYGGREQR